MLDALRELWSEKRRRARVLVVLDVSGSMGDPVDVHDGDGPSKLDLAKRAVVGALGHFAPDDEVGLWVFSTALEGRGASPDGAVRELVPLTPVAEGGDRLARTVGQLRPRNDTALYAATQRAYRHLASHYRADRIDAVVLLTDGHNEVGQSPAENDAELRQLLARLSDEGQQDHPVRVFTIAYGADADARVLRQIAAATDAAAYTSSDPNGIERTFDEAVSNL
jgi:Ca-activated chloride channel family protein